jgi:hypothetical protein
MLWLLTMSIQDSCTPWRGAVGKAFKPLGVNHIASWGHMWLMWVAGSAPAGAPQGSSQLAIHRSKGPGDSGQEGRAQHEPRRKVGQGRGCWHEDDV